MVMKFKENAFIKRLRGDKVSKSMMVCPYCHKEIPEGQLETKVVEQKPYTTPPSRPRISYL